MKNIHNPTDRADIIARLNRLSPNAERRWGTMNVEEMLWHCRCQLELALGVISSSSKAKGLIATPLGRWLSLYTAPWPRGAITAPQMNVGKVNPQVQSFEKEHKLLLERLEQTVARERLQPHPLFGEISQKDWGRLIWKHLDHHLRQFGMK